MAETEKDPEVQEILADLDNILADISGAEDASAFAAISQPPVVVSPAVAPPAAAPPAAAQLSAKPPPPAPKPAPALAPAPAPAAAKEELKIELAPREGTLSVPKKPVAAMPAAKPPPQARPPLEITLGEKTAAAPARTPTPAVAPAALKAPAAAPQPAVPAAPAAVPAPPKDNISEKTPKDQIRRVAILYTEELSKPCELFTSFLEQSALTVSKRPIYLRKVLCETIGATADVAAIVGRAKAAKAVAVLALIEGLAEPKARELGDSCAAAGLSYRCVLPTEIQKRSIAVDIMVDMMLLPFES